MGSDSVGLALFAVVLALGTAVVGLIVFAVFTTVLPKIIQASVANAPLDKLVVFHDVTVLGFTETGLELRLLFQILGTKLPIAWLKAGLAEPPTLQVSHVTGPNTSVPLATVALSDPITATGDSDLWMRQSRVVVTVLSSANVRALLRKIVVQKSVVGISVKVELNATIQVLGRVLYRDLALTKIVDLQDAQVRKDKALAAYLAEKKRKQDEAAAAAAATPPATPKPAKPDPSERNVSSAAVAQGPQSSAPPATASTASSSSTLPSSSPSSAAAAATAATAGSPTSSSPSAPAAKPGVAQQPPERFPEDNLLPGIQATRLPIETTLTSLSTGLDLSFSKPPPLGLRLSSVSFDILLNGSTFASGVVTGLHFHDRAMRTRVAIEIVPAVVSRPVRGLLSSARGVLQGAFNGTVSGLIGGEWGSGATVVKVANVAVADAQGRAVRWLDEVLRAVELEHDLDAVRRLGGAAKGAARDIAETVLSMFQGIATQDAAAAGVAGGGGTGGGGCVLM